MINTILSNKNKQGMTGVFTFAQLRNAGASATGVRRAVQRGELLRIAHGVYQSPEHSDDMDDEMYNEQLRCKQMIYSHDTALYLHGLNDRDPIRYTVTVPTGYNTKRLVSDGFKVFSLKKELHEQDIQEVETMYGNMVRTYNLERTICDCLRSRNKMQSEIVLSGLKNYVRRTDRKLNLLMETAERLKVATLLKTYMEVLI